ncbi:MAG: hypothetical protein LUD39_03305 [Opitutae bacterium]|nr:hypothetical protein [Opitutae bacterium]MCD8298768.1 hypothetical protein [Opitutae bacterium]
MRHGKRRKLATTMRAPPRVAVIDLGSNSLKFLVAELRHHRGAAPEIVALKEGFAEVRLLDNRHHQPESGIVATTNPNVATTNPSDEISQEKIAAGTRAVKEFLEVVRGFSPQSIEIVGTSVFRSATNADAFSEALCRETGMRVRVLSGTEEAIGIARGVATDPFVQAECARAGAPATVFDLGGGSLEFIALGGGFHNGGGDCGGNGGEIFARSFPLGAVRLTREFVAEPEAPIPSEIVAKIRESVRAQAGEVFRRHYRAGSPAVISGGAAAIVAKIVATTNPTLTTNPNLTTNSTTNPPTTIRRISVAATENLLREVASRCRADRVRDFRGLPAARADIFPTALAVFVELATICGIAGFLISGRNLRFGIAAEHLFRVDRARAQC